jgi:hypothetical protein
MSKTSLTKKQKVFVGIYLNLAVQRKIGHGSIENTD